MYICVSIYRYNICIYVYIYHNWTHFYNLAISINTITMRSHYCHRALLMWLCMLTPPCILLLAT